MTVDSKIMGEKGTNKKSGINPKKEDDDEQNKSFDSILLTIKWNSSRVESWLSTEV